MPARGKGEYGADGTWPCSSNAMDRSWPETVVAALVPAVVSRRGADEKTEREPIELVHTTEVAGRTDSKCAGSVAVTVAGRVRRTLGATARAEAADDAQQLILQTSSRLRASSKFRK